MPLTEVARRTIEGFGICDLREVSDVIHGGLAEWTRLQIWTVVRTEQFNTYKNFEWNPNKGFFGRITVSADISLGLTNPAILKDKGIEYGIQLFYEWKDDSRLTNLLIQCGTQKILQSIFDSSNLGEPPPITIIPLPGIEAQHCPARIIRLACEADSIVDIVVLVENALVQLMPEDEICSEFFPDVLPDDVPQPELPENTPTGDPERPSEEPIPSPPYDPATNDQDETPEPPVVQPLPGQVARIKVVGQYSSCGDRTVRPYPVNSQDFPIPVSVAVVVGGECSTGTPVEYKNIVVTFGSGGSTFIIASVLVVVPGYTIEYVYP